MGRADGIHFGTGVEPDDGILDILASEAPTILNEPEAKWWWGWMAQRRSGLTVWRTSPQIKPAQAGWDAHAYSREIFKSLDEHHDRFGMYPNEVLIDNETNLDYERGENQGAAYDTNPANWPALYTKLATFYSDVLDHCKERAGRRENFTPQWWFQGWAPGHGEQTPEIAAIWVPVAQRYDAVGMHAYFDLDTITNDILWYLGTFFGKRIGLFEWNMTNFGGDWRSAGNKNALLRTRVQEETRVRARLRRLCDLFPNLYATYFIDYWGNDDSHEHDIHGHDERMKLWDGRTEIPVDHYAPPGLPEPVPVPDPTPIPEPPPDPAPEPPMPDLPLGIDVASYQGNPDWAAVAGSGIAFAFTKATESVDYTNPTFSRNWREIKANGLYRGAYHYARPERGNSVGRAVTEAEYFVGAVRAAGDVDTGDMLVLDLEPTATVTGLAAWTLAWLRRVEALTGVKPLIYTGPWVIAQQGLSTAVELADYGLWLASYQPTMPAPVAPWSVLAFWQYTSAGVVPGIVGDVDMNWFNGPLDRIPLYGKPGAVVEPPSTPTGYTVGSGILDAMTAHGDVPASNEVYTRGGRDEWSEAFAASGARYIWLPSIGRVFRYEPAA